MKDAHRLVACMRRRRCVGLCKAEAGCGRAIRARITVQLRLWQRSCHACGRLVLGAGRALLVPGATSITCMRRLHVRKRLGDTPAQLQRGCRCHLV